MYVYCNSYDVGCFEIACVYYEVRTCMYILMGISSLKICWKIVVSCHLVLIDNEQAAYQCMVLPIAVLHNAIVVVFPHCPPCS